MDFTVPTRDLPIIHPSTEPPICDDVRESKEPLFILCLVFSSAVVKICVFSIPHAVVVRTYCQSESPNCDIENSSCIVSIMKVMRYAAHGFPSSY